MRRKVPGNDGKEPVTAADDAFFMEEAFLRLGHSVFRLGQTRTLAASASQVLGLCVPALLVYMMPFITVVGEARTQVFPCIGLNSLLAFLDSGG